MQNTLFPSKKKILKHAKHFDEGKYELIKIVLHWKPYSLPMGIRAETLLKRYSDIGSYYEAFKLPILEEIRAVIENGLEQVDLGKIPKTTLRLKDYYLSKNEDNPSSLIMEGSLKDEDIKHACVVLLTHSSGIELLGITSQDAESGQPNQLRIKVILSEETLDSGAFDDNSSTRWQLYALGSIVSQIRMYEVCTAKPYVAFMRDCLSATKPILPQQTPSNMSRRPSLPKVQSSQGIILGKIFAAITNTVMSFFFAPQNQTVEKSVAPSLTTVLPENKPSIAENEIGQERNLLRSNLSNDPVDSIVQAKSPVIATILPEQNTGNLNTTQQKAISDFAQLDQGLQLLQGPPGTGKTTTIIELLKMLCQKKTRILVCAPSNKAVQVLAKRFLETYPEIPMALAGIEEKLPKELRDIFIHTWGKDIQTKIKFIYAEIVQLKKQGLNLKPQQAKKLLKNGYQEYINILSKLKRMTSQLYFDERQLFKQAMDSYFTILDTKASSSVQQVGIELDKLMNIMAHLYHKLQGDVELMLLNHAQVIFATLCVSGRNAMQKMDPVDALIVDEAAQALEPEILIAFQHQPKKCLLVGDTKQLPALVQSERAKQYHLDWSMMWRLMEENNYPYTRLTTQYRMHPAIRSWPSSQYYENKLTDGDNVKNRDLPALPAIFMPYAFIDIMSHEQERNHSYYNEKEATYILRLLKHLRDQHKIDVEKRVGIITGYAAQVELIRNKLRNNGMDKVLVHTVDGYQGDECDFILISFVRSNHRSTIGFLKDFRRLNVAITRARLSLIMLGNKKTLMTAHSDIKIMLQDAEQRQCIFEEKILLQKLTQASHTSNKMHSNGAITTTEKEIESSTLHRPETLQSYQDKNLSIKKNYKSKNKTEHTEKQTLSDNADRQDKTIKVLPAAPKNERLNQTNQNAGLKSTSLSRTKVATEKNIRKTANGPKKDHSKYKGNLFVHPKPTSGDNVAFNSVKDEQSYHRQTNGL